MTFYIFLDSPHPGLSKDVNSDPGTHTRFVDKPGRKNQLSQF